MGIATIALGRTGGTSRQVWLLIARVVLLPLIPLVLILPTLNVIGDRIEIGEVRDLELTVDGGGIARVPSTWAATQSPAGEHAVLGLAASTNEEVISSAVEVTPTSLSIEGMRPGEMTTRDSYVQVSAVYMVHPRDKRPSGRLPTHFDLDEAMKTVSNIKGTTHRWWETGNGRGALSVVYWVGADAGPRTRAEGEYILRHLRVGSP